MSLNISKTMTLSQIKDSFEANKNIMEMMRAETGADTNDRLAIQISYDLQSGSYLKALENPGYRRFKATYCKEMVDVLADLAPTSVLEAGVGEATSLVEVIRQFPQNPDIPFAGFDLSWSRCHYARQYVRTQLNREIPLFVGGLESIPLVSDSVDLVFTAHAIEPNHGREREILRELYRVTQRHIVLFEPAYEFVTPEIRARMKNHGYCRGLAEICLEEGWDFSPARMMVHHDSTNPSMVLVIRKSSASQPHKPGFGCPLCHRPLLSRHDQYFCEGDGVVFPAIRGIPCLLGANAIIASKFLEEFEDESSSGIGK